MASVDIGLKAFFVRTDLVLGRIFFLRLRLCLPMVARLALELGVRETSALLRRAISTIVAIFGCVFYVGFFSGSILARCLATYREIYSYEENDIDRRGASGRDSRCVCS